MDPNNRGSQDYGHDGDGRTSRQRPPRDSLTPEFAQHAPALARTVQVVAGEYLLTVNPVDGSEIEICPPGERPTRPEKNSAAERAEIDRAARPPVPAGPPQLALPLLERQDDRESLVRLLARGRSVRLTGPAGSGRTALLDVVADDCADLAPDGVVRLSGFHRTVDELLHDLFHAVYKAPLHRPERDELLACVREIAAVVVLDDLEFGGAGLDELLEATPECAFLLSATPDVPAPSADSGVEEVVLDGLERAAGLDLLERAVGRPLTEEESNWAGDLWFESEGLLLRFVQAGALLRQRDRLRAGTSAVDEYGVFEDVRPEDMPADAVEGDETPLPSLGEAAAPAALLAARLSVSARATLRFAVALGGEVPHKAHLPALVGDTHADAALGELAACGLVSPVGSRYRLAAGVLTQLEAAGFADDVEDRARNVARHYAWWAGHPSVTPERVCVEADALLAALGVLAPLTTAPVKTSGTIHGMASDTTFGTASGTASDGASGAASGEDEGSLAVQLARTAAPAFAAGLHWGAWERALRSGAEAARLFGDVAEQAYFHHELGVLALCGGHYDRARAELEASIGLRGALSDKRGTVAGRRALALVSDRSGTASGLASAMAGEDMPDARHEESGSPARGVPVAFPPLQPPADVGPAVLSRSAAGAPAAGGAKARSGGRRLGSRNLVASGAGVLLVAVLGVVVTLGATSEGDGESPSEHVGVNPSASRGIDDGSVGADTPENVGDTGDATSRPTEAGADGTVSDGPTSSASSSAAPSGTPSGTRRPSGSAKPTKSPTGKPTSPTKTPTPTKTSTPTPTATKPTETPTGSPSPTASSSPSTSNSASGPATASSSAAASESSSSPPLI